MHLYLMRHGIAVEREDWDGPDETRPLTREGQEKTRAMAQALRKKHAVSVEALWASPLKRAFETAEIVGTVMKVSVELCEVLGDGADLDELVRSVKPDGGPERLMLVGHEPDLGYLLATLAGEREPRPFKKAGVAYLKGAFRRGGMQLKWQLAPRDLLGA